MSLGYAIHLDMTQLQKLLPLLTLLAGSSASPPLARACAVCFAGDGSVAEAYEWSVLFLMAMPYLVMGSIAGYLVYAYRRAVAKRDQEAAPREATVLLSLDEKESSR